MTTFESGNIHPMRRLPFDYARCNGTTADLCKTCRRREPGHPKWQPFIAPSATSDGCKNHIGYASPATHD